MKTVKDFKFPELNKVDMAFSTLKTDKELLSIAKEKGFYDGHTPYNDLFNKLFYKGGTLNFKKDIDDNFKINASKYLRSFMSSWEPKQEEKEAICALLLSELCDIV